MDLAACSPSPIERLMQTAPAGYYADVCAADIVGHYLDASIMGYRSHSKSEQLSRKQRSEVRPHRHGPLVRAVKPSGLKMVAGTAAQ